MIDASEAYRVVRAYARDQAGPASVGVRTQRNAVPLYASPFGTPPICAAALADPKVRKVCGQFYDGVEEQLGVRHVCPFGVELETREGNASEGRVDLFVQTAFHPISEALRALPRVSKKAASLALDQTRSFTFHGLRRPEVLDTWADVVTTLFDGRASASIRAFSHELLTPTQAILADVDALELASSKGNVPSVRTISARLRSNVADLERLAKKISVLLSTDVEFSENRLRKRSLVQAVRDLADGLRDTAARRYIEFDIAYKRGSHVVQAVPDLLTLAFSTLLENAVKYSFDGSPDRPRRIGVTFADEGRDLVTQIQSVGCAIDPDEYDAVFSLGYRGRHSGDRAREGTGSGLHIADQIISAHNGEVIVTSDPIGEADGAVKSRTTFTVRWPVYQPD